MGDLRAIEEIIVNSVKTAAKLGMDLSRKQIMPRTQELCKRMGLGQSYTNFKASKDWFHGLMNRFLVIVLRKPETLSPIRTSMLNPEVVSNYFQALQDIISNISSIYI